AKKTSEKGYDKTFSSDTARRLRRAFCGASSPVKVAFCDTCETGALKKWPYWASPCLHVVDACNQDGSPMALLDKLYQRRSKCVAGRSSLGFICWQTRKERLA